MSGAKTALRTRVPVASRSVENNPFSRTRMMEKQLKAVHPTTKPPGKTMESGPKLPTAGSRVDTGSKLPTAGTRVDTGSKLPTAGTRLTGARTPSHSSSSTVKQPPKHGSSALDSNVSGPRLDSNGLDLTKNGVSIDNADTKRNAREAVDVPALHEEENHLEVNSGVEADLVESEDKFGKEVEVTISLLDKIATDFLPERRKSSGTCSLTTSTDRSSSKTSASSMNTIEMESMYTSDDSEMKVENSEAEYTSVCSERMSNQGLEDLIEKREITNPRRVFAENENIGFRHFPEQVYRKAVRQGVEFSLMVVGESGLGKSTLVNSMFLTNIYESQSPSLQEGIGQTLQVETHHITLEERGVTLHLTVVDTPGFGVSVDNTNCWQPIVSYIDDQFELYLESESRVRRDVVLPDSRVHACLYFIAPTGHGLKPLDVEFMRKIHRKVNIIPLIGKSDCCTRTEMANFKAKVRTQLEEMNIETYGFPESELSTDDLWMRERLPFAVVGSTTTLDSDEGKVRGREYAWGIVNIENKDHCDYSPLRCLLLSHHLQDLRDVTHAVHYENYRSNRLTALPAYTPVLQSSQYIAEDERFPEEDTVHTEEDTVHSFQDTVDYVRDTIEDHRKKSWVVHWSSGRPCLQQRYVQDKFTFKMPSKLPGKYCSLSLEKLKAKSTENFASLRKSTENFASLRLALGTLKRSRGNMDKI